MTEAHGHRPPIGPSSSASLAESGRSELIPQLVEAVAGDAYWEPYLGSFVDGGRPTYALHLGVFIEPFLRYMLEGRKTLESRFSRRRFAPYQRIAGGDVVLIKRVGGPIVGLCRVADAWFYHLDPTSWASIRAEFAAALCAQDPAFWERRRSASFASLLRVDHVRAIPPLPYSEAGSPQLGGPRLRRPPAGSVGPVRPTALAFSGAIASGKTTLSVRAAELLGWPWVAFGDYMRAVATARGIPHSREVLQKLGADLIAQQGWTGLCRSVLAMADWEPGQSIVIDGVRHVEVLVALRGLVAPSELLLAFVQASAEMRKHRVGERDAADVIDLSAATLHSTEEQVIDRLPALADFTVDGGRPPADTTRAVLQWLQARQAR